MKPAMLVVCVLLVGCGQDTMDRKVQLRAIDSATEQCRNEGGLISAIEITAYRVNVQCKVKDLDAAAAFDGAKASAELR